MRKKSKNKIVSIVLVLSLVLILAVPLNVFAADPAPEMTLGTSFVTIQVDNLDGAVLDVIDVTDVANPKILPVGEDVKIPLPSDGSKVMLEVNFFGLPVWNEEHSLFEAVDTNGIKLVAKDGTILDTNENASSWNKGYAYFEVDQDATITADVYSELRSGGGGRNYYVSLEPEQFDVAHGQTETAIAGQLKVYYGGVDDFVPATFKPSTYTKGTPDFPFTVTESGYLQSTSNLSLKDPFYRGYVDVYIEGALIDPYDIDNGSFYLEIGREVNPYRYIANGNINDYMSGKNTSENHALNSTLSEVLDVMELSVPEMYNYTFAGWYSVAGEKIGISQVVVPEVYDNIIIARYQDASGKLYTLAPNDINGIPAPVDPDPVDPNPVDPKPVVPGGESGSGSTYHTFSARPNVGTNRLDISVYGTESDSGRNTSEKTVTEKEALAAVKAASEKDPENVVVTFKNPSAITSSTLGAMAKAAGANASTTIHGATYLGNRVDARISVNPALATKDINLSASTSSARAKNIVAVFAKYFSNKMTVVSTVQQDDFGMVVTYAIKLNADLNTETLEFYQYNAATNSYIHFTPQNVRVDANGYVHFTTNIAGDIIIVDAPLTKK